MEIRQKTYWSKTSIVVTVLVGALMAGVIYFVESVSIIISILLLLLLIVMCVTALMFMPVEVRLNDKTLTVMFPARYKDFPRSEIVEAVPFTDAKRMWRLCGSGAFFGWWGWFSAKGVGKFMMYASNLDHLLLIQLRNDKKYVFSCEEEECIISALKGKK